ncbi:MAG TPA: PRC-barrel domain-containing protein [Dongiaceae bacterium]|jgi:sporulation protein YlmC with PRC-barrel domain|nr:PRC-barrel domain-containing protein [Dongiaceae bacterium]
MRKLLLLSAAVGGLLIGSSLSWAQNNTDQNNNNGTAPQNTPAPATGTGTDTTTQPTNDTSNQNNGQDQSTLGRLTTTTPVTNSDGSVNVSKVIGLSVRNGQNESIGSVGDVVMDTSGQVKGVVVDVGGFLGIGARPVFLGWNDIHITQMNGDTVAMVNITKDRLRTMPEYNRGNGAQQ